ncbi:hypothetical protein [Flavihumibacter petaseus]|uniref:DUF2157 domain-containing protein n=1 Tax=Flavihumibacter petaseus NBRC 106054 TaxID=1220578 RepID=A0A0E9N7E4_9BACT|nr:hypothetical protein [Flavihumibacter petaseus]GAO45270.1 hypothetical protein FPE01S_04_05140 [Flavihumibacter petaseus NBRC 106054]
MIAYPKEGLNIRALRELAEAAHDQHSITEEEWTAINKAYPDPFFSPRLFGRIGFGILTLFVSAALAGILLMLVDFDAAGEIFLFMALLSFAALTWFVKNKSHFHSGIDDMLLHTGIIYAASGAAILADEHVSSVGIISPFSIIAGGLYLVAAFVFLNRIAALLVPLTASILIIELFPAYQNGMLSEWIIAAIMLVLIWLARKVQKAPSPNYKAEAGFWLEMAAAIGLYCAFNSQVVKDLSGSAYRTIGWFIFSWAWTIAIPILYLIYGFTTQRIAYIRLGLLGCCAIALTIQLVVHPVSDETMMVIFGIVCIITAAFLIFYYKKGNSSRYSFDPGTSRHLPDPGLLAAFAIHAAHQPTTTSPQNTEFGGGDFGGGGAGGDY